MFYQLFHPHHPQPHQLENESWSNDDHESNHESLLYEDDGLNADDAIKDSNEAKDAISPSYNSVVIFNSSIFLSFYSNAFLSSSISSVITKRTPRFCRFLAVWTSLTIYATPSTIYLSSFWIKVSV